MARKIINSGRGYSGREKVKMYQYDSKGKYLRSYESLQEVRDEYYSLDKGKKPLLLRGYKYGVLPDDTYISNYKIGRDELLRQERVRNCPFCHKDKRSKKFSVYNLVGERIAGFSSIFVASKLLDVPHVVIHTRLNSRASVRKSLPQKDNLIFKYD